MKLLITAGAGFIGSAVVRLAIERGHSVVNVDALTYAACLENTAFGKSLVGAHWSHSKRVWKKQFSGILKMQPGGGPFLIDRALDSD